MIRIIREKEKAFQRAETLLKSLFTFSGHTFAACIIIRPPISQFYEIHPTNRFLFQLFEIHLTVFPAGPVIKYSHNKERTILSIKQSFRNLNTTTFYNFIKNCRRRKTETTDRPSAQRKIQIKKGDYIVWLRKK